VRRISDLLSPSYFVQAQVFPYSYQDIVVRGNATKIDALFLREYLHQRHTIPQFGEPRPFAGGYTDMFHEGMIRNVWHCDVQSLYPSLMLAFDIKPRGDELSLFLPLLRDLRQFRLRAKADAKTATDDTHRRHLDAMQQTFKILINSFYGYLGFLAGALWRFQRCRGSHRQRPRDAQDDARLAAETRRRVIEIDTDGLYFVPPTKSDPKTLESELQEALPKGVDVEIDGQFPAMFSYKMKNYALAGRMGKLHVTGSALRSRGLEKFQRQFLEEMLTLALQGRSEEGAATLRGLLPEDRARPVPHRHARQDGDAARHPRRLSAEDRQIGAQPQCRVRTGPEIRPQLPTRRPDHLLRHRRRQTRQRLRQLQTRD
jgi:DNA polymerase, archaea type